jgi:hypothetical protein
MTSYSTRAPLNTTHVCVHWLLWRTSDVTLVPPDVSVAPSLIVTTPYMGSHQCIHLQSLLSHLSSFVSMVSVGARDLPWRIEPRVETLACPAFLYHHSSFLSGRSSGFVGPSQRGQPPMDLAVFLVCIIRCHLVLGCLVFVGRRGSFQDGPTATVARTP